jgi:hypothetical protein
MSLCYWDSSIPGLKSAILNFGHMFNVGTQIHWAEIVSFHWPSNDTARSFFQFGLALWNENMILSSLLTKILFPRNWRRLHRQNIKLFEADSCPVKITRRRFKITRYQLADHISDRVFTWNVLMYMNTNYRFDYNIFTYMLMWDRFART